MKHVHTVAVGAAALATAGVLFATTAAADPTEPAPTPSVTPAEGRTATLGRGAGFAWFYGALTDVQRQCLADARLQRPQGRLTDEQRADLARQVQAALGGCGVELPPRVADRPRLGFAWASLTAQQQRCLAETKLTRPLGRLTDAQREAVKQSVHDAVAACR